MGQKVKGYRRNAEYGRKTRRLGDIGGWRGEVNPPGKDGWEKSGVGRSGKEYGESEGRGNERVKRVEEVRRSEGYESNGLGRKGDGKKGYVVYGEYVKVVERPGKRAEEGRESRRANKGRSENKVAEEKERQLEVKRERRVMRYEWEVGRKVTRERVNRSTVREDRGRLGERGGRMRGRAVGASSGKGVAAEKGEEPVEKKDPERARVSDRAKRRKAPEKKGEVRREARGVVVVLGGVIRVERRRVKRRIRKREGAGRGHRRARREREGRRKYHGRKSKYGRVEKGKLGQGKKGEERKGGYYGYRVRVKGPLNGARRTTKREIGRGTVPGSRKEGRIGTAEGVAKTSVGTRGVQVAYCYGRG